MLGWGTYKGGLTTCGPSSFRAHEVEIIEKAECEGYYGNNTMTERMLCARPRDQKERSCIGDTGGWSDVL